MIFLLQVKTFILPPIFWNSSNPLFKSSNIEPRLEVNLEDEIDFLCPHYSKEAHHPLLEYYIVYQVTPKEFDDCILYTSTARNMIVNCSSPYQKKRFTIIFERYSAIPNGQEFFPGHTYHYITTSSGKNNGVLNHKHGSCLHSNMKLKIHVQYSDSTTDVHTGQNLGGPLFSKNMRTNFKYTTPSFWWIPTNQKSVGLRLEEKDPFNQVIQEKFQAANSNSYALSPHIKISLLLLLTFHILSYPR